MRLKEVDVIGLYHKWTKDANFFECFVRTGVFATMKHYNDFELDTNNIEPDSLFCKIVEVIDQYSIDKTIFILDLPDILSINQGYLLNNYKKIKPIIIFNFLLHDFGLVGSKEFVNNLAVCGSTLNNINAQGYAFILDYNRYNDFTEQEYIDRFNNQYELSDENLPDAIMLRSLKYENIVYISLDKEKEDIKNYLEYLSKEKFNVENLKIEIY